MNPSAPLSVAYRFAEIVDGLCEALLAQVLPRTLLGVLFGGLHRAAMARICHELRGLGAEMRALADEMEVSGTDAPTDLDGGAETALLDREDAPGCLARAEPETGRQTGRQSAKVLRMVRPVSVRASGDLPPPVGEPDVAATIVEAKTIGTLDIPGWTDCRTVRAVHSGGVAGWSGRAERRLRFFCAIAGATVFACPKRYDIAT